MDSYQDRMWCCVAATPAVWEPRSLAGATLLLPCQPRFEPSHHSCLQVGDGDFFWEQHGRDQFPKAAADSDLELNKYKAVSVAAAFTIAWGVYPGVSGCTV